MSLQSALYRQIAFDIQHNVNTSVKIISMKEQSDKLMR